MCVFVYRHIEKVKREEIFEKEKDRNNSYSISFGTKEI